MKKPFQILFILLFLNSCSTKEKNDGLIQDYLTNGTYYLKGKLVSDTLIFNTEKIKKGDWNYKIWIITNDTIFQEDCRGLSYLLGEDRRKYKLKNDTLYIWTNSRDKKDKTNNNDQEIIEKYLVLKSDKNKLEIIDLNRKEGHDSLNEIRSDIQLR